MGLSIKKKPKLDYNKVGARGAFETCGCSVFLLQQLLKVACELVTWFNTELQQGLDRDCAAVTLNSNGAWREQTLESICKKTNKQTPATLVLDWDAAASTHATLAVTDRKSVSTTDGLGYAFYFRFPRTMRATNLNTHTATSESDLCAICGSYLQRKCCRLVSDVSPDNVTLDRQHATLHFSNNSEVDFKQRAHTHAQLV